MKPSPSNPRINQPKQFPADSELWPRRSLELRCRGPRSGPLPPFGFPQRADISERRRWPGAKARRAPRSARARTASGSMTRRRTTPRRAASTLPTSEEKQGENLKVSMLVGPWIHQIQAKCSNIGIVVGQKIHLMQAVLLPLTVHMMIETSYSFSFGKEIFVFTLSSCDCIILRINTVCILVVVLTQENE